MFELELSNQAKRRDRPLESRKSSLRDSSSSGNGEETMARLLVSAGYEVSKAEHGFSALLQLRRDVPDLILSDLNMPQMSGFEFLSVVRRRFPDVLVVAMSGTTELPTLSREESSPTRFTRRARTNPRLF